MTVYGIAYVDAEGHIDSFYIPGPTGYPEAVSYTHLTLPTSDLV